MEFDHCHHIAAYYQFLLSRADHDGLHFAHPLENAYRHYLNAAIFA